MSDRQKVNPGDVLKAGAGHIDDRAAVYDSDGERSIPATVEAFNAITGHQVTEEQGWLFMMLLKAVRSQQGFYKLDNYEDGAAYFAFMAETASLKRGRMPEQQELKVNSVPAMVITDKHGVVIPIGAECIIYHGESYEHKGRVTISPEGEFRWLNLDGFTPMYEPISMMRTENNNGRTVLLDVTAIE